MPASALTCAGVVGVLGVMGGERRTVSVCSLSDPRAPLFVTRTFHVSGTTVASLWVKRGSEVSDGVMRMCRMTGETGMLPVRNEPRRDVAEDNRREWLYPELASDAPDDDRDSEL